MMMYFRKIALAVSLAGVFAAPAFAQTAPAETTAPAAQADTPMPDTGIKKTAPVKVSHKHRVSHRHVQAKPVSEAVPPASAK